jgi:hypothetical protein
VLAAKAERLTWSATSHQVHVAKVLEGNRPNVSLNDLPLVDAWESILGGIASKGVASVLVPLDEGTVMEASNVGAQGQPTRASENLNGLHG